MGGFLLGMCIGKNLVIRYRGCDTIYCNTVCKLIYWVILGIGYIFKKAVIKSTPPYVNLSISGSAFALIGPCNIQHY